LCVGISHEYVCGYCAMCISCKVHKTTCLQELADLKARIIAVVKNIDAPMLTCVWGKNLNIVSMCAVSPVVHTSNVSSCQKNCFSFPVDVNNSIKVGPLVFLL